MVPSPVQQQMTFRHQNESNSPQKCQYGLGSLGGSNNGPTAKKKVLMIRICSMLAIVTHSFFETTLDYKSQIFRFKNISCNTNPLQYKLNAANFSPPKGVCKI